MFYNWVRILLIENEKQGNLNLRMKCGKAVMMTKFQFWKTTKNTAKNGLNPILNRHYTLDVYGVLGEDKTIDTAYFGLPENLEEAYDQRLMPEQVGNVVIETPDREFRQMILSDKTITLAGKFIFTTHIDVSTFAKKSSKLYILNFDDTRATPHHITF